MESLLYIGAGGFLGANARYALSQFANAMLVERWGAFPYGTLAVNALGSFGLALFGAWFSARGLLSPQMRLLIGVGFFGAFTTFSTFASESVDLLRDDSLAAFLLNLIINNSLCLLAIACGLLLGERFFGAP